MHDLHGLVGQTIGFRHAVLAEHLNDKAAFRLVRLVLNTDVAALDGAFASTTIICTALEDGLKSLKRQ